MNARFERITPFLWFNDQAEEAANFYVSAFDNSRILTITHYSSEAAKASGRAEGSVMTVAFQLDGQHFTAINGGPVFKFNPSVSFVVNCQSQEEIDHFWNHLSQGGDPSAQQCGWLQDRYGLSWQVVPKQLVQWLTNADQQKAKKAMQAMLSMKKIDLGKLEEALI